MISSLLLIPFSFQYSVSSLPPFVPILMPFFAHIKSPLRDVVDSGSLERAILFSSFSFGLMFTNDNECLCKESVNKEHVVEKKSKKLPLNPLKIFFSFALLGLK